MTEPNDIFKKAEEKVSNEQAQNIIANKDADWIMNTEAIMTELKEAAIQIIAERKPDVVPIIEQLKNKYKELFLYFFSEDEFYVYRPISRFEHKDLS
ncbi:MAG TPA: hypothetical protein PK390_02215 [Fervidobacterium nodosum]|nr:hypothetical protein [Fervidobacterium nodosum]